MFTNFLVETAKARDDRSAPATNSSSDLIENANTTFKAVGDQQNELSGRPAKNSPERCTQGNKTFTELPPTLAALEELVNTSKPTTQVADAAARTAAPAASPRPPRWSKTSPSASAARARTTTSPNWRRRCPALAKALATASPATVQSLKESIPITAFFGPYSPDLAGTLRSFGQSAAFYDADGHYAHVAPVFPSFDLGENNNLTPSSPQSALANLKGGQLRRCPGAATEPAADNSSPFADGEPAQLRPGRDSLMGRRRSSSIAGSPLLIGAVTTLIVVVAVYLSYNANNGLPFVPTYNIKVELPAGLGAAGRQPGASRRHPRGHRQRAEPAREPAAPATSPRSPTLKLEKKVEPLPANTTAAVQSVSTIGLKYLELEAGNSLRDDQGRADDPGQPDPRTGEHRRTLQHVRQAHAHGDQDQHQQLRRRSRRPRRRASTR